jgi:hypothetical protein
MGEGEIVQISNKLPTSHTGRNKENNAQDIKKNRMTKQVKHCENHKKIGETSHSRKHNVAHSQKSVACSSKEEERKVITQTGCTLKVSGGCMADTDEVWKGQVESGESARL